MLNGILLSSNYIQMCIELWRLMWQEKQSEFWHLRVQSCNLEEHVEGKDFQWPTRVVAEQKLQWWVLSDTEGKGDGEAAPFPLLQESWGGEKGSPGVWEVCGLREEERTRKWQRILTWIMSKSFIKPSEMLFALKDGLLWRHTVLSSICIDVQAVGPWVNLLDDWSWLL